MNIDGVSLTVFCILFALVTVVGFAAVRWRRADSLAHIDEWGLGGRSFGSFVTWFLLGGDLYTAYTFVAVPALMFGAGAIGFFAVPYTIIVYPLVFVLMPRLWSVSHRHGYVTPADFVPGRFGSPTPALAVAPTATPPPAPPRPCRPRGFVASASRPSPTRWPSGAVAGRRTCRWRSPSQSWRRT